MRKLILFLAAAAAFGQSANVLTITASRQLNIQPDQVSMTVYVDSDPSQTLDSVLAALPGTKIAATDLSNVSMLAYSANPELEWVFRPTVPFSDLNSVTAVLGALQTKSPIRVSYFYLNATASPEAMASQPCPYPSLINDAQAQAGKLAAAAGVTLGPIVSLEQGSAVGAGNPFLVSALGFADLLLAPPVTIYDPATTSLSGLLAPSSAPTCTLTVQFKLGQ